MTGTKLGFGAGGTAAEQDAVVGIHGGRKIGSADLRAKVDMPTGTTIFDIGDPRRSRTIPKLRRRAVKRSDEALAATADSVSNYARYLTALDPRSLACFRTLLALVLLHDVHMSWTSLQEWAGLQGYYEGLPLPVLPYTDRAEATLALLFLAYAGSALVLMAGYHTRISTFLTWAFTCGHQYAVRHTGDYHDLILATLFFWCQFINLGTCWSIDSWRRARRGGPTPAAGGIETWGRAALLLNVAYIYASAALLKTGSGWWQDGTAVFFALKDFVLASDMGTWLVEHLPFALFRASTHMVVAIELAAPLLLLSPWRRSRARLAGCILLLTFEAMLWIVMDLEAFPLTMIAAVWALLPASVWERLRLSPRELEPRAQQGSCGSRVLWRIQAVLIATYLLVNLEGHRLEARDEAEWLYAGAEELVRLQHVLGMELVWKMYAPEPIEHCGWWVGVGITEDGREVDPVTWRRPTLEKPSLTQPPFAGLGGLYWFDAPSEDGWPQNEYAHYVLWRDEALNPPGRQLSHFLLLYMHERYWPLQNSPHAAVPLLVLRWPDDVDDPPPPLTADSVLQGLDIYEMEFGRLEKKGWEPVAVPPLLT